MRFALVLPALCLTAFIAPSPSPSPPKLGAEARRLAFFEGKWKGESEMKTSAGGPGTKITTTEDCRWSDGGFQIVCRGAASGETHDRIESLNSTTVIGWSPAAKTYRLFVYGGAPQMLSAEGSVSGKTWTWISDLGKDGKTYRSRYTMVEVSPTSYTSKWEISEDGNAYRDVMEGTVTREP